MQATVEEKRATAFAESSPRSLTRALADLRDGFAARELWSHLGWQDIKQRYRRSVLGPFWITISQAVIALGLGLLYGVLFGQNFQTFLPYVLTGLITWTFIQNCLTEGMETFIANEGLIKHLPAPISIYTLRTVWRQFLMFAHNAIVYVVVVGVFFVNLSQPYATSDQDGICKPGLTCHPGLDWHWFLGIPGFLLVIVNMAWITMFFGIISTRFRDFPQLINAIVQLMFYLTPIVWPLDQLTSPAGPRHELAGVVLPIIKLNPIYHLIQVVRAPFIGQVVSPWSYVVCGGMAIVGWFVTVFMMRNYRARISYWV
ncbi:ABC transporter permease [Sciscionella sediminilitoris]|uniref:galactan export ABC transporter permease subunit Wzm/RfbD n=1 Tax=Sciscionella sediminilitoris TaxID=1445613 RepID=UPI0004DEE325|nr:ABC transporter permease [Sciscionella sp. SE31]